MVLSYAFCNASIAPIRREPTHRAEQVTQMLFGERCEILEIDDREWAKIRCEWDKYEGWCKINQLTIINRKEYNKTCKAITANSNGKLVFDNGDQWLPMGADLFGFKKGKASFFNNTGKYKGKKLKNDELELTGDALITVAKQYLHAPYLWGGRTIAGIDCSGLTQMAFKLCGKAIPRDTAQQATEGELVDFLQHAIPGDLAFFNNADGKIVHVGLLLDKETIIHATETIGRVVIDKIDPNGIISVGLKKRTHHLRFVKRFF